MNKQTQNYKEILSIIESKHWYKSDSKSTSNYKEFNYRKSFTTLYKQINKELGCVLNFDDIFNAYRNAFSSKSLFKTTNASFAQALVEIDKSVEVFVWTVGDTIWQKIKIEKTGLNKFFDKKHIKFEQSEKVKKLPAFLEKVRKENKEMSVFVLDDKESVIKKVKLLKKLLGKSGISIFPILVDQDNPKKDSDFIISCISKKIIGIKRNKPNSQIVIVSDMDGTLVDTDSASVSVAKKLSRLV